MSVNQGLGTSVPETVKQEGKTRFWSGETPWNGMVDNTEDSV